MKHLGIFFMILSLTACSITKKDIESYLTKNPKPLGYLHDSSPLDCKNITPIFFELHDSIPLKNMYNFDEKASVIIPLVFYNAFHQRFEIELGQNMINVPYDTFFTQSFITESQRSGCGYYINNGTLEKDMPILRIRIDKCLTKSILRKGFGIGAVPGGGGAGEYINNKLAVTQLMITAELAKNNVVIMNKVYEIEYSEPDIPFSPQINKLHLLTCNMSETLSIATKEIIENIVWDINEAITDI